MHKNHPVYLPPILRCADLLCEANILQNSINQVDPFLAPGVSAETYTTDAEGFNWDLDV